MDKDYSALIIDIKKSKSYDINVRNDVQEHLTKCIKLLNNVYKTTIACDVTFSAGDELQGLFNSPLSAVMYWRILEFLVYPVQIRAGIGVGEWNVRIDGGPSTEQDGPAYHNARNAIKEVHKRQMQSIRINSKSERDIFTNYIINNSMGYKRKQNHMQNVLQLVSEIMYPFVEEDKRTGFDDFANKILELKGNYKVKENTFSRPTNLSQTRATDLNDLSIYVQDEISISGLIIDYEEVVTKKGMSINIAKVMHKSRQNIDVVMKRGNILLIRGMDYMALQYIKKNYGE